MALPWRVPSRKPMARIRSTIWPIPSPPRVLTARRCGCGAGAPESFTPDALATTEATAAMVSASPRPKSPLPEIGDGVPVEDLADQTVREDPLDAVARLDSHPAFLDRQEDQHPPCPLLFSRFPRPGRGGWRIRPRRPRRSTARRPPRARSRSSPKAPSPGSPWERRIFRPMTPAKSLTAPRGRGNSSAAVAALAATASQSAQRTTTSAMGPLSAARDGTTARPTLLESTPAIIKAYRSFVKGAT